MLRVRRSKLYTGGKEGAKAAAAGHPRTVATGAHKEGAAALSEEEEEARAAAMVGALLSPRMEEWKRRLDSARLIGQQVEMNQL